MNPPLPPAITPPVSPQNPQESSQPSVAHWRWWIFLLLLGSAPLLASLSGAGRAPDEAPQLPKSIPGLLLFCALQMGVFGVLWGGAWAFSRASKDQLFLRWRDGWKSIAWGALYSLALRLGIFVVALVVVVWVAIGLTALGYKPEQITALIEKNQPDVSKIFLPALQQKDPLYRFLLVTLVSFVVAGLREELWRAATLAGMLHLAPEHWSQKRKIGVALGVSSVLFGLGHVYQGPIGVALTGILGIGLGAIILRHRSIWPAVIAHGFFNAASFVALMLMRK
ncbi:MAG: CPBP family intramembrane metalloprotease [Armatimonadetes bacterium]|nr:CPBP family intramembrane metalloprotease [Armatimonadota bacterium]